MTTQDPKVQIELHSAYQWDCLHCGEANWQRGVMVRLSDEALAADDLDPSEYENNRYEIRQPANVRCHGCHTMWECAPEDHT